MKNFHFYAELPEARGSKSASKHWGPFTVSVLWGIAHTGLRNNCIAVPLENGRPMYQGNTLNFDAFGVALEGVHNSVEGVGTTRDYLRKRCVRISEDLARKLHPALFTYLEKS